MSTFSICYRLVMMSFSETKNPATSTNFEDLCDIRNLGMKAMRRLIALPKHFVRNVPTTEASFCEALECARVLAPLYCTVTMSGGEMNRRPNCEMSMFGTVNVCTDAVPHSAAMKIAIDEALLETATDPTRFHGRTSINDH